MHLLELNILIANYSTGNKNLDYKNKKKLPCKIILKYI